MNDMSIIIDEQNTKFIEDEEDISKISDLPQLIADSIDSAKAITNKIEKCEKVVEIAVNNARIAVNYVSIKNPLIFKINKKNEKYNITNIYDYKKEATNAFELATKSHSYALLEVKNLTKILYKLFDLILAISKEAAFILNDTETINKIYDAKNSYEIYKSVYNYKDNNIANTAINNFIYLIEEIKNTSSEATAKIIESLLDAIAIITKEIEKVVRSFNIIYDIKNKIEGFCILINNVDKITIQNWILNQNKISAIFDAFRVLGIEHTKTIVFALNAAANAAAISDNSYNDKIAIACLAIQEALNDK